MSRFNYIDCIDCKDRHKTCHSTCEKYLKAKIKSEKDKKAIRDIYKDNVTHFLYKKSTNKTIGRK